MGELSAGSVVADRYVVEGLLGEGGMGSVWAARHLTTRKRVALKVLKPVAGCDARMRQRFLREARAACAVQHPSIIQVHDVLDLEENPVIVMELLEGETFAARLHREQRVPIGTLASILLPVCSAVGKAHEIGIVHRDLKPENIFLSRDADDGGVRVKVLDFGIAKLTATDGDAARSAMAATGTGMMLGTPFYMSPEQMFGERDVDHRTDIWAIGIILYEALAGVRPTEGENVGQILKIVTTDAIVPLSERVKDLPVPVTDLVARMLRRDRKERPADLNEVCDVLRLYSARAIISFGPAAPYVPTPLERSSPSEVLAYAPTASDDSAVRAVAVTRGSQRPRLPRAARLPGALAAVGVLGLVGWRVAGGHPATTASDVGPAPAPTHATTAAPDRTATEPRTGASSPVDTSAPAAALRAIAPAIATADASPAAPSVNAASAVRTARTAPGGASAASASGHGPASAVPSSHAPGHGPAAAPPAGGLSTDVPF
jgi:serine/threonine-protein kinase